MNLAEIPWLGERLRRARVSDHPFPRWLYTRARSLYRVVGRTLWFLQLGWVNSVRGVRHEGGHWVVEGWAYHRGTDFGPTPEFRAWLTRRGRRVEVPVETTYDIEARAAARAAEHDYARNSFRAQVPDDVLAGLAPGERWRLRVQVRGNGHRVRGPLTSVNLLGSAAVMTMRRRSDGIPAGPYLEESGLWFGALSTGPVASEARVRGGRVEVVLPAGTSVDSARLVGLEQLPHNLAVDRGADGTTITVDLPAWEVESWTLRGEREAWTIEVTDDLGRAVPVAHDPTTRVDVPPGCGILLRPDARHRLEIVRSPHTVVVDAFEVVEDARHELRLAGTFEPSRGLPRLVLRSRFEHLPVEVTAVSDDRFEGTAVLRLSRWDGPALPPPRGTYALVVVDAAGEGSPTFLAPELGASLPQVHPTSEYRLRVVAMRRDQLGLRFGPPRTEEEFGAWRQLQLRDRYALEAVEPLDAVYFESFFGRNATDNPLAIDAELARRHPEIPRYWGVQDLSIAVPDGAVPLVRGTADWWRVRGSARWIVTNEWLRTNFVKRPFQTVLQTWHGSMYKQIGLDRVGRGKAHLAIVRRERAQWDLFISQAAATTPIIRSAYGLDEQIIETGYPRNDELIAMTEEHRRVVRERIGVPEGVTVVMYAPTWREAVQEDVALLDLEQLSRALGPDFVLLRRGHVRALRNLNLSSRGRVVDVSTYPHINDLLGVADVLITDYSSMMFDFTVTGRPLLFYTPDIDQYTDTRVRGSYFDLESTAPGPVTRDPDEIARLLRELDIWPAQWKERYSAWRERYNHLDDGHASARALDALLRHRAQSGVARPESDEELDVDDVVLGETEGPPSEPTRLDTEGDPDVDEGADDVGPS